MRVLVSGAGIAGLTVASLLRRAQHDVLVVEQSPAARGDGYMIDFFGPGYDVAEEMSLLAALKSIHRPIPRREFLDRHGRTRVFLDYSTLRGRLFGWRHFNFLRGDLEAVLLRRAVDDGTEIRFGTTIASLRECGDEVMAWLSDGTSSAFDLVIGADGVRSNVRRLAFGPLIGFARLLGYNAAAYTVDDPDLTNELAGRFVTLCAPGRQVTVYPITETRLSTFFVDRAPSILLSRPLDAVCERLTKAYGDLGWIVPRILARCCDNAHPYYDAVLQIDVAPWRVGRVVLIGDAGYAVPLFAGQGASLAMAGAAVLALALQTHRGDVPRALMMYEQAFRPVVAARQHFGRRFAGWFLPTTHIGLRVRDLGLRLSSSKLGSTIIRSSLDRTPA